MDASGKNMFAALFLPVLVIAVIGIFRLGSRFFDSSPSQATLSTHGAVIQKRLRLAGIIFLVGGLPAAGLTFLNAPVEEADSAIGYEIDGGTVSPMQPEDSKSYDRTMESMGGKVSELATDFAGLWQGRKLAYTLAFLSLSGALVCFGLAHLQACAQQSDNNGNRR